MRLCLLSYFDVGVSFGLGDDTFLASRTGMTQVPEILNVGIRNPLGEGIVCHLQQEAPDILQQWQRAASELVGAPEMEVGIGEANPQAVQEELRRLILAHPIAAAEISIHAIGTALLYVEMPPGIPVRHLRNLARCYEFAAYERKLSEALQQTALRVATGRAVVGGEGLRRLTKRPPAEVQVDEHDREESRLLTAFSWLALAIDAGDDIPAIAGILAPPPPGQSEPSIEKRIRFELHGTLHFSWPGCLVVPRPASLTEKEARIDIARMLVCIRIAHVFLGTCEAFEKLFLAQTLRQADSFLKGGESGLGSKDLNRLRTLALAVVSLTNFTPVAACSEDQDYFACFERHAQLAARHALILTRCEILYNVQLAETQAEEAAHAAEEARQQRRLSAVVLILTGLTFISILSNSYNFLKEDDKHLVTELMLRADIVGGLAAAIILILLSLLYVFRPRLRRKDQS